MKFRILAKGRFGNHSGDHGEIEPVVVVNMNEARRATWVPGAETAEIEGWEPLAWKHNALRHSFISYRLAAVPNTAQVALEAGNSPQMIFRHYRELVRAMDAEKWFAITPEVADTARAARQAGEAEKIVALPKQAAA